MNILAKREIRIHLVERGFADYILVPEDTFFCLVGENLWVTSQASARRRAAEGEHSFRTAGSVAKYTSESEER